MNTVGREIVGLAVVFVGVHQIVQLDVAVGVLISQLIYDKLYSEIKEYFVYMANITGTLWEHDSNRASMNHGFTSHVIVWMDKLGLLRKRT